MFGLEKIKELDNETEVLMKVNEKMERDINILTAQIRTLESRKEISVDLGARIAELELKMSKLWSMLLETTPTGKEKLSKFGRKFGGMSKVGNR